jgi:HSP20 family protein
MLLRTDPFAEMLGFSRPNPVADLAAMDAYRHGDVITVEFDLPGVDPSSIDLQIERGELRLQAKRAAAAPEDARYLVRERPETTISRRLVLGDVLDVEHVDAEYVDGVLRLRIPLMDAAKPRQIEVRRAKALESESVPIEATAK